MAVLNFLPFSSVFLLYLYSCICLSYRSICLSGPISHLFTMFHLSVYLTHGQSAWLQALIFCLQHPYNFSLLF